MKTAVDSLSYAYGVGFGTQFADQLKQFPSKINVDLFLAVFEKTLKGDTGKLAISPEEAFSVFERCLERAKIEAAETNKVKGKEFLEKNAKADGVQTTASGLQYKVIKDATGPKPSDSSIVVVHYQGTLLDGEEFDSSIKRGQPQELPLGQVIRGWSEGIKLMSVGAKYKFWIPAELAYGEAGVGPIKPNETLVFEVELLQIK